MKNITPESQVAHQKLKQRSTINRPHNLQLAQTQSLLPHEKINITQPPIQQLNDEPSSAYHKPTSQKIQQLISLFKLNEISTKSYRLIIEQIAQSFTTMDSLTTHLEQKVDHMLKLQQNQFVQSYKTHMKKVQEQFASVDKKIEEYENKIAYYENQGEMSQLFIKVNKLQEECRRLYKDLAQKDKASKDHLLTIKVQRSQLKRYEKQLKLLLRQKNDLLFKLDSLNNRNSLQKQKSTLNPQEQPTQRSQIYPQLQSINSTKQIGFLTELESRNKNDKSPNDLSTQYQFGNNQSRSRQQQTIQIKNSLKSLTIDLSIQKQSPLSNQNTPLISKIRQMQLKRELNSLKKRNQKLNSFQSYVLQAKTDMQSFFIQCVNQIKQQIKIRKKINMCTFEDWKKQDKIQLLIKIISNDDILAYLYERVFRKKKVFGGGGNNSSGQISVQEISSQCKYNQHLVNTRKFQHDTIDNKSRPVDKQKHNQSTKNQKHQKTLSAAKKRFSKHVSENTLLPKIHFHLEY